jgi:predicted protein tyrosine phosphatase
MQSRIIVLSRRAAVRFRQESPYVVVSIRSPGDTVPKLRSDPFRIARINLAFYDTTPEWEARLTDPVPAMTALEARRIAHFVASHWGRSDIVIHCVVGISRSAGAAVGILDAFSQDAREFQGPPYEPNPHVRREVYRELMFHAGKSPSN